MEKTEEINRIIGYYIRVHYELHGRKFKWEDCIEDIKNRIKVDYEMNLYIQEEIQKYLKSKISYGVFLGRCQPFTNGHNETIQEMIRDGVTPVIILGSINKTDDKNPLSFDERKKLIKKVYPVGVKILGLEDKTSWEDWMDSALELFRKNEMNPVNMTLYSHVKDVDRTNFEYKGVQYSSESYTKMFELNNINIKNIDEKTCFLGNVIHASDVRKDESIAKRNLDARVFVELKKMNWWK